MINPLWAIPLAASLQTASRSGAEPAQAPDRVRASWTLHLREEGVRTELGARSGRGESRWIMDVHPGAERSALHLAAEAPGLGGRWILGSQSWPALGSGWASALAARSGMAPPTASTRTEDTGIAWFRNGRSGLGWWVGAGRRGAGQTRSRTILRFEDAVVGWLRDGDADRAFAAWTGNALRAPARLELLGGGSLRSARAGLGGGREAAGILVDWRADGASRMRRVRGGIRAERAARAGASLEVELSALDDRRDTRVLLGASTRLGGVLARVDARARTRNPMRSQMELGLPLGRGTLDLVVDVSGEGVDAVELRAASPHGRARLHLPATGPTRATLTIAQRRVGAAGVRATCAWERGRTTSLEVEWSVGDDR